MLIRRCRLGRFRRLAFYQVFIGQYHHQGSGGNGNKRAYDAGQRASKRKSNDHGKGRKIERMAHDARREKDTFNLEIDSKENNYSNELLRRVHDGHRRSQHHGADRACNGQDIGDSGKHSQ